MFLKLGSIKKAIPTSPSSESIPRGEKSGQIRVNPGQARVPKSRPGHNPGHENGPFSMTRVALDPPFLTRATALCTKGFKTCVEIGSSEHDLDVHFFTNSVTSDGVHGRNDDR
jgi:hypothetical protein